MTTIFSVVAGILSAVIKVMKTGHRGSLSPQRGEISPKRSSRTEPLNRLDSSSLTDQRRMIHPLLGERTEVRASVLPFFLGSWGGIKGEG